MNVIANTVKLIMTSNKKTNMNNLLSPIKSLKYYFRYQHDSSNKNRFFFDTQSPMINYKANQHPWNKCYNVPNPFKYYFKQTLFKKVFKFVWYSFSIFHLWTSLALFGFFSEKDFPYHDYRQIPGRLNGKRS